MAKRAAKTVAVAIHFEERRVGNLRAVNYGGGQYADDIVVYHDSNPDRAIWNDTDWERLMDWMNERESSVTPAK